MEIQRFWLEGFLSRYEFTSPYMLCSADCETISVEELLAYEPGSLEKLQKIRLGYTDVPGSDWLREEIASQYTTLGADHIMALTGGEEAVFAFLNAFLKPGDHVVCMTPTFQSMTAIPQAAGCQVSEWPLEQQETGWKLDIDRLESLIRDNTKLIIVNSPDNPTGYVLSAEEMKQIAEIAEKHGIHVFANEICKGMELDGNPVPWFADVTPLAVSLGAVSKAHGLGGLRLSWLASADKHILEEVQEMKYYLTCCGNPISEFLGGIALRNSDKLIARNMQIIRENMEAAEAFFTRHPGFVRNNRPMGGPLAFHELKLAKTSLEFCDEMAKASEIVLLPAQVIPFPGNYVRMSYAKRNFKECLGHLEQYLMGREFV